MDSHDLIHEMEHDNFEEMRSEEDPNIDKKPFRLTLSQLHCYKVTDGFSKVVYARVSPMHLPEIQRYVAEGKVTLNGMKKIFPGTQFITMNIQVIEKDSEA